MIAMPQPGGDLSVTLTHRKVAPEIHIIETDLYPELGAGEARQMRVEKDSGKGGWNRGTCRTVTDGPHDIPSGFGRIDSLPDLALDVACCQQHLRIRDNSRNNAVFRIKPRPRCGISHRLAVRAGPPHHAERAPVESYETIGELTIDHTPHSGAHQRGR